MCFVSSFSSSSLKNFQNECTSNLATLTPLYESYSPLKQLEVYNIPSDLNLTHFEAVNSWPPSTFLNLILILSPLHYSISRILCLSKSTLLYKHKNQLKIRLKTLHSTYTHNNTPPTAAHPFSLPFPPPLLPHHSLTIVSTACT